MNLKTYQTIQSIRWYSIFQPPEPTEATIAQRAETVQQLLTQLRPLSPKLLFLTGAGISTESLLPDYRSPLGAYSRGHKPVTFQQFTKSLFSRQRFWLRGWRGFAPFQQALPNAAHRSIAALQQRGHVHGVITQNVDRLHHKAGSKDVLELHGNMFHAACMACGNALERQEFHREMEAMNPGLEGLEPAVDSSARPDGDAELAGFDVESLKIPDCRKCGGMMKPTVVFFGESIPKETVQESFDLVDRASGIVCVGSSLQVFSSFRLVRHALSKNLPVFLINLGETRADDLITYKIHDRCAQILPLLVENW